MGPGKYVVNLTLLINGSISISNDVVQGIVTGPLYDHSPVVIYGITKVLMPVELPHPTLPMSSDASSTTSFSFVFSFFLVLVMSLI
jgi:hypothetical protein